MSIDVRRFYTPKVLPETVPSGIEGLDKILLGGFPRGAVVLLAGNPGTGKSTFAARFVYEGCRRGERSIYLNFVEPRRDFYDHMTMLGMDFEECERKGLFHYMEAVTIADEDALITQLEDLVKLVMETKAKRVAIDSITAMLQIVKVPSRVRELLQNIFVNGFKPHQVTTVLIAEHPYGAKVVGYGIEEFIVDAVFILKYRLSRGKIQRVLEIRKARWAPIHQAEFPFRIKPGIVIDISLPEEPEEIPPLDYSRTISLCDTLFRVHGLVELGIGAKEITRAASICDYLHIAKGSQVLIGVSPVIHSTLVLSTIASSLMLMGEDILIVSFKNSSKSIADMLECSLRVVGSPDEKPLPNVVSVNPTVYTLVELIDLISSAIDQFKPSILLVDGLEAIEVVETRKERYYASLYNLLVRSKKKGVTGFYLYSVPSRVQLKELPVTPLFELSIYIEANPRSIVEYEYEPLGLETSMEVYHPLIHVKIPVRFRTNNLLQFCTRV
ncbi:ATPase domain-containing protein [Hyperthermus butylicus]|uniref:non-specific serine/threonine protein kinase n=1 Tax=Hyperthermus butylicus (strain DSM 5456 / JCM 9403 / PLM1-5) TaxID=415426 RepID=A2BJC1_HYPBU|nr:ATPase domain-containing protein [Hyperthermus butylicus]ABM80082.1 RecA-like ATPase (KaiC-like) [Hyperthermus butylicus DSM 5456]